MVGRKVSGEVCDTVHDTEGVMDSSACGGFNLH
jgi:hypothetical protein